MLVHTMYSGINGYNTYIVVQYGVQHGVQCRLEACIIIIKTLQYLRVYK